MAERINEDMILEMLRLEYDRRLEKLGSLGRTKRELDVTRTSEPEATTDFVVSPGLMLKHKRTGLKFQVISVERGSVVIRSPEGKESTVSMRSVSTDYLID